MCRRQSSQSKTGFQFPSPSVCRENLEFGPLSPLLFGPNPLLGDPEIGPCSQSGAHWGRHTSASVHIATQEAWFSHSAASLHANWVHGPGPRANRRGLGYGLQLLLGLPDVMELLELFHHVVFEVWI